MDYVILFIFFIIIIIIAFLYRQNKYDTFINNNLQPNEYPNSTIYPILDYYEGTGKNIISNSNFSTNWKHYPIFSLPSFKQITNNFKYIENPDNGTCTPSELCFSLYQSKLTNSNEIIPLPEAPKPDIYHSRINYYLSKPNLLYLLIPFN